MTNLELIKLLKKRNKSFRASSKASSWFVVLPRLYDPKSHDFGYQVYFDKHDEPLDKPYQLELRRFDTYESFKQFKAENKPSNYCLVPFAPYMPVAEDN